MLIELKHLIKPTYLPGEPLTSRQLYSNSIMVQWMHGWIHDLTKLIPFRIPQYETSKAVICLFVYHIILYSFRVHRLHSETLCNLWTEVGYTGYLGIKIRNFGGRLYIKTQLKNKKQLFVEILTV